ncbi:MAG: FAD-binding oxidoreductase [Planctomycetia bacterium]|nr:FAD-binding oxidoreductase [Planctomycetia bacterium]
MVHLVRTAWQDVDAREPLSSGQADDASRLNRTRVAEVWRIPADRDDAERQLADLLRRAKRDQLRISIAGARHSMGGHTIYPGGIVIDMRPFRALTLNADKRLMTAQAGATWEEIIPYLDAQGLSVAVMQSNNSFTVGGSLGANCHGWQYGSAPIASTVESFRLMSAEGSILRCSRQEHAELFSLTLGGYGLFGIILEAELRVVPNQCYQLEQAIVPTTQALTTFDRIVAEHPDVEMMYARMSVAPERFLDEVILNAFYPAQRPDATLPELHAPGMVAIRRSLFRGSAGSDYGKALRWEAETKLQPHLCEQFYSRNQLLNESTTTFENRFADSTDILHEYFVPRDGVARFVAELKKHLPQPEVDLLNVTIREVEPDRDTFLRYAEQPMFSFVMLFQQRRDAKAETSMKSLTRKLIDAANASGGRYYLPYRLHATSAQLRQAYPQVDDFFARKRRYDPDELFQNQFYVTYRESPTPQTSESTVP